MMIKLLFMDIVAHVKIQKIRFTLKKFIYLAYIMGSV